MSGIQTQTFGQCKMQLWRHPENSNQMTDVFTFHLLKLGSAVAQLLSRSSIMTVGTSSTIVQIVPKYVLGADHVVVSRVFFCTYICRGYIDNWYSIVTKTLFFVIMKIITRFYCWPALLIWKSVTHLLTQKNPYDFFNKLMKNKSLNTL
jgi:thiamine transporter ThiT